MPGPPYALHELFDLMDPECTHVYHVSDLFLEQVNFFTKHPPKGDSDAFCTWLESFKDHLPTLLLDPDAISLFTNGSKLSSAHSTGWAVINTNSSILPDDWSVAAAGHEHHSEVYNAKFKATIEAIKIGTCPGHHTINLFIDNVSAIQTALETHKHGYHFSSLERCHTA